MLRAHTSSYDLIRGGVCLIRGVGNMPCSFCTASSAHLHARVAPIHSQHIPAHPLMGKNKTDWRQLDKDGCQRFDGADRKPQDVIVRLQAWGHVKKGHCSAQLCSTGAACIVCSACKEELSPANYSGSWSQHRKTCKKLPQPWLCLQPRNSRHSQASQLLAEQGS
jgi:hypothetical protein